MCFAAPRNGCLSANCPLLSSHHRHCAHGGLSQPTLPSCLSHGCPNYHHPAQFSTGVPTMPGCPTDDSFCLQMAPIGLAALLAFQCAPTCPTSPASPSSSMPVMEPHEGIAKGACRHLFSCDTAVGPSSGAEDQGQLGSTTPRTPAPCWGSWYLSTGGDIHVLGASWYWEDVPVPGDNGDVPVAEDIPVLGSNGHRGASQSWRTSLSWG